MKILVCVKQVLDGEAPVGVDASGRWFAPEATPIWRMNTFDAFAVEEALRVRERVPDTTIDAISVGPRVAAVLTRALEMGADAGVHLVTESEGRLSPRAVASAIAAWAGPRNYDLILTGAMSEDVMDAQVGPMLAALLGRPWATAVMRMDLSGWAIDAYPRLSDRPEASGSADRTPQPWNPHPSRTARTGRFTSSANSRAASARPWPWPCRRWSPSSRGSIGPAIRPSPMSCAPGSSP